MPDEITLRTVLEHMTAMEQRLAGRLGGVELRLGAVETRISGVESRLGSVERRIDALDASLSRQIDGIDKRLDEVEIERLPKRLAVVEAAIAR